MAWTSRTRAWASRASWPAWASSWTGIRAAFLHASHARAIWLRAWPVRPRRARFWTRRFEVRAAGVIAGAAYARLRDDEGAGREVWRLLLAQPWLGLPDAADAGGWRLRDFEGDGRQESIQHYGCRAGAAGRAA